MFSCVLSAERTRLSRVLAEGFTPRKKAVPSREYLERQATVFLDLARSTKNPELAAALADSAAHYTSQAETIQTRDTSPRAPDVEM
jgi:hypothetical protein